jgi:hypothetical protein
MSAASESIGLWRASPILHGRKRRLLCSSMGASGTGAPDAIDRQKATSDFGETRLLAIVRETFEFPASCDGTAGRCFAYGNALWARRERCGALKEFSALPGEVVCGRVASLSERFCTWDGGWPRPTHPSRVCLGGGFRHRPHDGGSYILRSCLGD